MIDKSVIEEINKIISDCDCIFNNNLKTNPTYAPMASLTDGRFLSIYKRTIALIADLNNTQSDIKIKTIICPK